MSRTLKLTVSYDGTPFVGWQRQAEGVSVQGLLEDALARFEGAPVAVHGAGRTDAGVHALGQVASAQLTSTHGTDALMRGLNACLPPEVRVTAVEEAAPDFHARFSARSKTYRYLLRNAPFVSPFERAYVWHVPDALDLMAMRAAADALVGTHDFSAFQSVGSDVKDATRTVGRAEVHAREVGIWEELFQTGRRGPGVPQPAAGRLLACDISADGFLRHMVRAIVGTLVEIGRGRRPAASMAELVAGGRRGNAGATAPPQGLFLVAVHYD